MREETLCMIKAFDGCDCRPGECKSEAVKIGRVLNARKNAYSAILVTLTVLSLCLFAGVAAYSLVKIERTYQLEARI